MITDEQGEAIEQQLTERQIALLLHHVEGEPMPSGVTQEDYDTLVRLGLMEERVH